MASPSIRARDFTAEPYWWRAFRPDAGRLAALPARARVAIVGGGYAGLSTAIELARLGIEAVVLEAHELGHGASSRNAGFVSLHSNLEGRYGHQKEPDEADRKRRHQDARDAFAFLERLIEEEGIACHYRRSGHYTAAYTRAHRSRLEAKAEKLNRLGDWGCRMVGEGEQRGELGSDLYRGGMVIAQSGLLHPALYYKGLLDAVARRGVTLAAMAPVTRIVRVDGAFEVETARGTLKAGEVVIATNGYTGPLTPKLQRGIIPIGSYMIATEPIGTELARKLVPNDRSVYDTRRILAYCRLAPDEPRLLFGGRVRFGGHDALANAPLLYKAMVRQFPELDGVAITHAWTGNLGFTLDEASHAGTIEGMRYLTGCNGAGVGLMTYLGTQTARQIAGRANYVSTFENPDLPTHPLYNGRPWFLPVLGSYYRARDWLDRARDR